MKSEIPCGIIRDLLPSYIDNLTSEESKSAVKEHLKSCKECRNAYSQMTDGIESNNIVVDEAALLKKSKKKFGRKLFKTASATVLIFAILLTVAYGFYFAYWGRRHSVLYDVKSVTVEKTDNNYVYNLVFEVSVRNWYHDIIPKTYRLEAENLGAPGYFYEGKTDYFTTGNTPVSFIIKTEVKFFDSDFDMDAGLTSESKELIKEAIRFSRFAAFNKSGKQVESATLYTADSCKEDTITFVE